MVAVDGMEKDDPGLRLRRVVLLSSFQVPSLNPGSRRPSRSQLNMLGRCCGSAPNGRKARDPA